MRAKRASPDPLKSLRHRKQELTPKEYSQFPQDRLGVLVLRIQLHGFDHVGYALLRLVQVEVCQDARIVRLGR